MILGVCIVGGLLMLVIWVARVLYLWDAPIPVWHIADVAKPQKRTMTLPLQLQVPGVRDLYYCTVRIQGEIDGRAKISAIVSDRFVEIGPGEVDLMLFSEYDYYSLPWCIVGYWPREVENGSLRVTAVIGEGRPKWARRPPIGSVPGNDWWYWEVWYPGGGPKHSEGWYYQRHKIWDWSYYDRQGNVIRKETWEGEGGKLMEREDVNPSATPTQGGGE